MASVDWSRSFRPESRTPTLVWTVDGDSYRAVNRIELNRIDSFVALNQIESFSFLPNRPSLVISLTVYIRYFS